MLTIKATPPRRKLHLSSTTVRMLSAPSLNAGECVGAHSVSCHKPEDETKNNCTVPTEAGTLTIPVSGADCDGAPPPAPLVPAETAAPR
jgi:hypothetical protein